ncbi:MAG: DUF91 domain-containing protein [Gammaproteobacteria bacterium]|nr:DUF91 domain-containing protein [Gammaproteobacteria bacterium]
MPEEIRLWRIEAENKLREVGRARLDFENRLEAWLEQDISVLDPDLLVIGRQVGTDFGGSIDIVCLDQAGDVVVVELMRDRTPREITAQVLDYGSWVKYLSHEKVTSLAESYLGLDEFEENFKRRFGSELPEILNENHRLMIVASELDASSERIIRYLSDTYGVNINVATFQYFREPDGSELLARVFLLEPAQVELQSLTKGASKRRPKLTYEKLDELAQANGVNALYRLAVAGLGEYLQKHTTRSSIGFAAKFDGSRKNVVSLIPQESNAAAGLRFQLYLLRLRTLFNLSEDAVLAILPPQREFWEYYEGAGPELSGLQGFFANDTEINRFLNGLKESRASGNSAQDRTPTDGQ